MTRPVITTVLLLGTLVLAGCYESPDVTLYEPGVYKGPRDPLLEKQRSPQQQQTLQERLKMVQTDR